MKERKFELRKNRNQVRLAWTSLGGAGGGAGGGGTTFFVEPLPEFGVAIDTISLVTGTALRVLPVSKTIGRYRKVLETAS